MKIAKLTALFALLFLANLTQAQVVQHITGDWEAECLIERIDQASIKLCDLCPKVLEDNSLTISSLLISFNDGTYTIGTDKQTGKYDVDAKTDIISFSYNKNKYEFKVLASTSAKDIVLRADDGTVLLLRKK